jgi:hypothetical protein
MASKNTRASLLVAVGLGVLAAIGAGKLTWEHRKARLEDAFRMLTAGSERLNEADPVGAQQQFQNSIDQFRALGRDPLLALHYAFAARLRAHAADMQEVRELSVPSSRQGETLLAVGLSQDSTLIAVTTTHRLLCLVVDNQRWAEWELPRPIESAGALHVDSATGKAHVIVSDDGRLLTADCRVPGSPLIATASASGNQAAVAWVDADEFMAWVAPTHPAGAEVKITARPLPGAKGEPLEIHVAIPGQANSLFAQAAVVHSIAKVGDDILLFYGDPNLFQDSDLRDESVLVIAIDEPQRQTNRLVFPAFAAEDPGGKVRWRSTRVRRLLPASAPGRIYALTEGPPGVAVLGADARPIDVHSDSLFSTEYREGREIYDLSVKSSGKNAVLDISRRGTASRLSYELPWRFRQEPELAAISREGRHVVVATAAGSILLIDLAKSPALSLR